jgi:hypothetical protein
MRRVGSFFIVLLLVFSSLSLLAPKTVLAAVVQPPLKESGSVAEVLLEGYVTDSASDALIILGSSDMASMWQTIKFIEGRGGRTFIQLTS